MNKIKVTADYVLSIIQGIFNEPEINIAVDDPDAPPGWIGKTVSEILNVEYYTFKHRPNGSADLIKKAFEKTGEADTMTAVSRAFCLLSLTGIEHLFSKDADMTMCTATLDYYVQTNKIKLLEHLIESANLFTNGLRISVQFGDGAEAQTRQAVVVFERPNVGDIQTVSTIGEVALVSVDVSIIFHPDAVSYSDYEVYFEWVDENGNVVNTQESEEPLPCASVGIAYVTTNQAVPTAVDAANVGSINLSASRSFSLVFEGYKHPFVNYLARRALADENMSERFDINSILIMTIIRDGQIYKHNVRISKHEINVTDGTGNETHTVSLATRG